MAVHGEYKITISTPNGDVEAEASVDLDGEVLTGEMHANGRAAPITDGHFHAGAMTWKTHVNDPAPIDLEFEGHCEDDVCSVISGDVHAGDAGTFHFKGQRV